MFLQLVKVLPAVWEAAAKMWAAIALPEQPASVVVACVTHPLGTPDPAPDAKKTKCEIGAGVSMAVEASETSEQELDTKKTKCELAGGGLHDGRSRAGSHDRSDQGRVGFESTDFGPAPTHSKSMPSNCFVPNGALMKTDGRPDQGRAGFECSDFGPAPTHSKSTHSKCFVHNGTSLKTDGRSDQDIAGF